MSKKLFTIKLLSVTFKRGINCNVICNVKEAVEFLKANKALCDSKNLNTFDYFRIYPSLAGKIAYIYYRFDAVDEGFIESVEGDNKKYKNDREKYIKIMQDIVLFLFEKYKNLFFKIECDKVNLAEIDIKALQNLAQLPLELISQKLHISQSDILDDLRYVTHNFFNIGNPRILSTPSINLDNSTESGIYNHKQNIIQIYTQS